MRALRIFPRRCGTLLRAGRAKCSGGAAGGGFTLLEVCVALAVLSAGVVVFGRYLDGFGRIRSLERGYAKAALSSVAAVEHFVRHPPPCADSAFAYREAVVVVEPVPGAHPLAWVRCGSGGAGAFSVRLRRLVRCVPVSR
jgi:prepilin-type N-terminal cleavage/methylation domain-containing protein